MTQKDRAFGILTLAVAVVYYWAASRIPESQLADTVGPRALPIAYALALAILSVILILRSFRGARAAPAESASAARLAHDVRKAAGTLAFAVLYVAVVPWLGYFLSLAALIFATARNQGAGADGNRRVAIVALGGALFCWLLFVVLMGIPQPRGPWPSLP